jgi:hypothetical protein
VRASHQLVLTFLLVAVVAGVAVVANLFLLRSTQDSSDPVGRLSPRAVFSTPTPTAPSQTTTIPPASSDDGGGHRHGGEPDD